MNPLTRIDDLLFDRMFQPLVNRFPDSGPTGVARFFLMGSFLAGAAERTLQCHYDNLAIGALLNLALYLLADWPCIRLGLRNSRRITERFLRAVIWMLLPVDFVWAKTDTVASYALCWAADILFLAYLYACACDKLPPRRVERRATWWQKAMA